MKALTLVLLVACGGGSKAAESQMPTLPDPAGPGTPNGLTEPVLSAVRGIPMYVTVKGLFLDHAETVEAEEIVAAWASAQGVEVLPPEQTSLVLRRALAGKHATTGHACGAPLFEFQAVERWKAELGAGGKLEARVSCAPDCVMQVAISIGTGGQGGTEFFAAPFDPSKPWRDELKTRLPAIVDNGGHNKHGHLNNPVTIEGISRDRTKLDVILDDDSKLGTLDATETAAAMRCIAADRFSTVVVEYGDGKIARCLPAPQFLAGAAECVCAALADHTGTPNTRERFEVSRRPEDAPTRSKSGLVVRAFASAAMIQDPSSGYYKPLTSDPAIEQWEPPDRAFLAPCFVGTATDAPIEGRATVEFDAVGNATRAYVVAMKGTFTPAQQTCLQEQFMAVRAPCPSMPGSQATAELKISFDQDP